MSATEARSIVTGVDFVSIPTSDLERAIAFYGETLGLHRSVHRPDRNFAEFETGTVTLNVLDPERMGIGRCDPTPTRWRSTSTTSPPRARRSRGAA